TMNMRRTWILLPLPLPISTTLMMILLGSVLDQPAAAQSELLDRSKKEAKEKTKVEPGGSQGYALVRAPSKQVRAELTVHLDAPPLAAREWIVYAAQLPVLPCQTGVSSVLTPDGESGRERSPEQRPILRARIGVQTPEQQKNLDLRIEY